MYAQHIIPYNEAAIQNIRRMLEVAQQNGTPLYFEFSVDGMRLIPATQNVAIFDSFKSFLHPGVNAIEFKIYQQAADALPLNTFTYSLSEPVVETKALSGVDMEERMLYKMDKIQQEFRIRELEKELQESRAMLEDQEKWIDDLTQKGEELKSKLEEEKNSMKGLLKDILNYAPDVINAIPKIGQLQKGTPGGKQPKVSFSLQGDSAQGMSGPAATDPAEALKHLSPDERRAMTYYIGMGKVLEENLEQEELELFLKIAETMYQQPDTLHTIAELLDIDTPQSES